MALSRSRPGVELFTDVGLSLFTVGVFLYSKQSSDRSAGRVQGLILARGAAAGIAALGLQVVWAAVDDPLVGNLIDAGGTLALAVNLGVPFGVIRGINRAPVRRNATLAEHERAPARRARVPQPPPPAPHPQRMKIGPH